MATNVSATRPISLDHAGRNRNRIRESTAKPARKKAASASGSFTDLDAHRLLETLAASGKAREGVVVGIGSDVAVVRAGRGKSAPLWALKCDPTVESVHFERGFRDAKSIARKAVGRPCSDLAAACARPRFVLASVELNKNTDAAFAKQLLRELYQAAGAAGAVLVGGHTSFCGIQCSIHVTVVGELVGAPVSRRGARAGDQLLATGDFGASIEHKHFNFSPRIDEMAALAEKITIHASIDVSDSLALDSSRLAAASGARLVLDEAAIPLSRAAQLYEARGGGRALDRALYDGEDYEILLAVPAAEVAQALQIARIQKFALTPIGKFERGGGVFLQKRNGKRVFLEPRGHVHRLDGAEISQRKSVRKSAHSATIGSAGNHKKRARRQS